MRLISGRRGPLVLGGLLLVWAGSACAGSRIEGGVFYSPKGFRVTLPAGGAWTVAADGRADLELRLSRARAGILINATCGGSAPRRPLAVLARQLTFGVQGREALERDELRVAGHEAIRVLFKGRLDERPVQVEAYVVKGEQCVYDLVYVAPPEEFAAGTEDFGVFVRSFVAR